MTILHRAGATVVVVMLAATASRMPAGAVVDGQTDDSAAGVIPGEKTQLVYEDCYEHLGRFGVPLQAIGIELPEGFGYLPDTRTGGVTVNVVALDCRLGGERVVDIFIAAPVTTPPGFTPPEARGSLLLVRRYTSRPEAMARFAQWCFGNVVRHHAVDAQVTIEPDGARTGRVSVDGGERAITLITSAPAQEVPDPAATIHHFTTWGHDVGGRLTFSAGPGTRAASSTFGAGTLMLDGVAYPGLSAHVYPQTGPDAQPFDFTYSGLTCPAGLIDQTEA